MSVRARSTIFGGFLAGLALFFAGQALADANPAAGGDGLAGRHVQAQLVADADGVRPGGQVHVALVQKIQSGWHTYWRNPGDSGQSTTIAWTLPAGWKTGDIVWPKPKQLRTGPLMDYGYEGEVILPQALTAPADAKPGQSVTLKAVAQYLVCKDVCVPEDANLTLTVPVVAADGGPDPAWGGRIATTLAKAPKPGALTAVMTTSPTAIKLSITGEAVKGGDFPNAYFYPYDPAAIDHPQPQVIDRGPEGLTLTLAPGSGFKSGPAPTHLQGVIDLGARAYEIDAKPGPAQPAAAGLGPPSASQTAGSGGVGQFGGALVFAFLGGLILNLMPCVFPVLSMKAVSLASHAHSAAQARGQGLAFLAGVVATFVGLAALLIAARAAGQAVGWGFQLQSPAVIAALCLVMLLVALNLAGLFEVGQSLQSAAGNAEAAGAGGLAGAFFTGVLAVAVAAPCTAPFMAPAIGFALTQAPPLALGVFLALGLGMAAPFTLIAFAPALLRLMPRPGAWMETFKKVMAFPMFATAAWLLWVFSQQVGPLSLGRLLGAAVLVAFAAWLYGRAQAARYEGRGGGLGFAAGLVLMVLAAVAAATPPFDSPANAATTQTTAAKGDGLASQPFSPDKLDALRADGHPVFVDFTAAWCVTCQVNDKLALSSKKVADAFAKDGVVFMKGDWTNRDPVIAKVLADHGRAGVPLYLVYPAKGGEPQVLPQILTEDLVLSAVDKAARS
ncbi:protein-disulfide reductase DsbD family protein [Phenylobacterium montanum]|uniref:Thioredoxin family protein n=1 Tax=Phenylobacterium montanum TaxID=2823693 RepID=A0A975ISQ9_9CAUL|nr:protein-disulfide reductase DsbD domain-containing protein [Caulobacter sp. S6]QUD85998.1 thioredoxin family protein [Caulobacter sp. S6]